MKKRYFIIAVISLFALMIIAGCSGFKNTGNRSSNRDGSENSTSINVQPANKNPRDELILNIMDLARQGKIINCEFPVKTTTLDDVEAKWGDADNTAAIPAAKGTYSTYSAKNVVFGWNKGMQIFEARSFDSRIKVISLEDLTRNFGAPPYDVRFNGQEIIGYTAGTDYKLLFVLSPTTDVNPNPRLDHYSVLYPQGTVNSMADDPGRQW